MKGPVKSSALFLAVALGTMVGCASTPKQEGTGEYIDDAVITTRVKAAILNEPTLNVAEVNVETYKGAVQLSGLVSSQAAASRAVALARGVEGVKFVKDGMRLKREVDRGPLTGATSAYDREARLTHAGNSTTGLMKELLDHLA
jgi:hyperosmotically inducible protein